MARTTAIFYKPQHLFADTIARMIKAYLLTAALALSLATTAQAQSAPAAPSPAVQYASEKFAIASLTISYDDKGCEGITQVQYEAARIARDHYSTVLEAEGAGEMRAAFAQKMVSVFLNGSCTGLARDQYIGGQIKKAGLLVDELLLAVHYSTTATCGYHKTDEWAMLRAIADATVPSLQQRPDFSLIDSVARERALVIDEDCAKDPVVNEAMMRMLTPYGAFLFQAAEAAKARATAS